MLGPAPVLSVTALAMTVPLLLRRRSAVAVAIGVAAVFSAQSLLLAPPDSPGRVAALVLASWSLGAYATTRRAAGGLVVVLLLLLADVDSFVDWLFIVLLLGGPWFGGVLVRRYRLLVAELEQQREQNARHAVAAERARIAREMHDVLAHTLSTIGIQAEAASQFLDRPERARPWLESIGLSVREAMSEVRVLVDVLRDDEPSASQREQNCALREPSVPGLADLPRLVAQSRSPGLKASIVLPPELPSVSTTSAFAAYRIVQEALSNVRRHAQASEVLVEVGVTGDCLEVAILDNGVGPPDGPVAGYGLLGMTERAELCGGRLTAAARPRGGFGVRAQLPVELVLR